MNIEEFYKAVEGDYSEIKRNLVSDEIILRILKKYPDDKHMEKLEKYISEGDMENAFVSAHALKGISSNLHLEILRKLVSDISDRLKNGEFINELSPQLKETNLYIIDLINKLE